MPGCHTCTSAPTVCGQRTPMACPKHEQPERVSALPQTPLTQAENAPPPRETPCQPDSVQRQLARACAAWPVLGPHTHALCAHETRTTGPSYLLQGRVALGGRIPNPRRLSIWRKEPSFAPSREPCGALRPAGHASQWASARSPRLHSRINSNWAYGPDGLPPKDGSWGTVKA